MSDEIIAIQGRLSNFFYEKEWEPVDQDGYDVFHMYSHGDVLAVIRPGYVDFYVKGDSEAIERRGIDREFLDKVYSIEDGEEI